MTLWIVLVAGIGGCALGFLLALLWRAQREHAARIELELLRARVKSDESAAAERDAAIARMREQLQAVFGELARTSLQSNNEMFLQLARERLDRDKQDAAATFKERETAIESLIQPIREAIGRTESQIQSIERERIDAFAGIRSQMELLTTGQHVLSRETRNLVTALRRPDVRGRWGEMTLKRLVELSGMSAHADFTEQHHHMTESGAIRPDMIVHMPERRDIVVDVKTPLDAYLAAVEAQTEDDRGRELKRHAQVVSARVRELAGKQYWAQFEHSPDFVVLFLPGDQFLSAALQENPDLIDESLRQNVMLATPDQPGGAVEDGRARLETGGARRERGRDPQARRGHVQATGCVRRPPHQARQGAGRERRFIQQGRGLARAAGNARGAALPGTRSARQSRARADRAGRDLDARAARCRPQ